MIKAEGLKRSYGDFVAVDGVSFEIQRGEIVGLLGHNGAGKTTIMKMLTGFLEPDRGQAFVDGHDVFEETVLAQEKLGYLPENSPIYPEMTVIDYLLYVAELRDIPSEKRIEAVRETIQKTGLEEKAKSSIQTLSRGYKQRVGVAQAIIHNPDILILDEPTNGLDPTQIVEMRNLIKGIAKHATVILSTHIMQEVQAVCDRVIVVVHGKIALDSKLSDIQASDNIVLEVEETQEDVQKLVQDVDGIDAVEDLSNGSGLKRFLLHEAKDFSGKTTPVVAKKIVDAGLKLHAIHHEKRDLETVFRELNS